MTFYIFVGAPRLIFIIKYSAEYRLVNIKYKYGWKISNVISQTEGQIIIKKGALHYFARPQALFPTMTTARIKDLHFK